MRRIEKKPISRAGDRHLERVPLGELSEETREAVEALRVALANEGKHVSAQVTFDWHSRTPTVDLIRTTPGPLTLVDFKTKEDR